MSRLRFQMEAAHFEFRQSRIGYHYHRGGETLMVCFHGYDENGASFAILENALSTETSILAIDLPFHGATDWQEPGPLNPADLRAIISGICHDLGQPTAGMYVAGFSMGGRVALSLLEQYPDEIFRVLLIAPDGLRSNFWYTITTANVPGRRFFRFSMSNAGWLKLTLRAGRKLSVINQTLFKFSYHYLKDQESRDLLYNRWVSMRLMRPSISKVKSIVRQKQIPVSLIYGESDRIMRAETGRAFSRNTDGQCNVEIINCGHQVLHPRNSKTLSDIFRRLKF